jgi:hypothetical protein
MRKDEPETARVFVDEDGERFEGPRPSNLAGRLRAHLKAAGVNRAELYRTTDVRKKVDVHSLRATMITASLACGRTETWVSDRTGHRSSAQINDYRRGARHFSEMGLGGMSPLHEAIPEFQHDGKDTGGIPQEPGRDRKNGTQVAESRQ